MEVVFSCSSSVSWVSGSPCSWCVYSLPPVVLYNWVGDVLLSPCDGFTVFLVVIHLNMCCVRCTDHLDFVLCEFVHR